jgi:hypothetical protein
LESFEGCAGKLELSATKLKCPEGLGVRFASPDVLASCALASDAILATSSSRKASSKLPERRKAFSSSSGSGGDETSGAATSGSLRSSPGNLLSSVTFPSSFGRQSTSPKRHSCQFFVGGGALGDNKTSDL